MQAVFFFRIQATKGRSCSQAFLAETVKTGNKNRCVTEAMLVLGRKLRKDLMRCRAFPERVGPRILLLESVACENIRFSTLFAAGDVSRGGTSATPRHKFHADDGKSVRNPIRRADWSTEQLHCFSYCLRMTEKR